MLMVKNASVHIVLCETFILPWLCTSFTKHVTLLYPGFILFSLNMSLCVFRTFFLMWWKFALCGQGFNSVIAPKYGNVEWIFGITDDMAKPLHRYLSDHPCWVAFTGTIHPTSHLLLRTGNNIEWRHIKRGPCNSINLEDSGVQKLQKIRTGADCTKFLKCISIIRHLR